MKRILLGLVAATLPLAVACTGGATAAPSAAKPPAKAAQAVPTNAQQVTIKGFDTMKFEPTTLTVKAGQPVALTFENDGATIHDFTLPAGQGVAEKVQILAPAKGKNTAVFTIDKPGTYTFVCAQPGHEAAGMKGTIIAQ